VGQSGDKHDRDDARAAALVVWREAPARTPIRQDTEPTVLDVLITEREDAVAKATRLHNQLHQLLLRRDPDDAAHLPGLRSKAGLAALAAYTTAGPSPVRQHRAGAVRRVAQRPGLAQRQAAGPAARIHVLAAPRFAPLTRICRISLLTAAALAGIRRPGQRCTAAAQRATYAGVAPLEASAARRVRHRRNRGGTRRCNAIRERIAVTQARCSPQAPAYLARRAGERETRRAAIRALQRFLVRAIWRRRQECSTPVLDATAACAPLAARSAERPPPADPRPAGFRAQAPVARRKSPQLGDAPARNQGGRRSHEWG
jgi:transposase